jgi:predicted nucleotide-binding protein
MAPRRPPPSQPEPPVLTVDQLHMRMARLQDCITALGEFDPEKVQKRYGISEVMQLEASIKGALAAAFGDGTPAYNRYRDAASLNKGPHVARTGDAFGRGPQIDYDARDAQEARKYLAEGKQRSIGLLQEAIRALEYEIADRGQQAPASDNALSLPSARPREVFVVHGHDEGTREAVARFLERIGFRAIILHEQANKGRTVIEKVVEHGDVGFAVVLLTPDDEGYKKGEAARPRARQNVLLELGYFIGRLGRQHVCALKRGDVELPSDFGGVVYETFDDAGGWRQALGRELHAAGFEIDWNLVMRP